MLVAGCTRHAVLRRLDRSLSSEELILISTYVPSQELLNIITIFSSCSLSFELYFRMPDQPLGDQPDDKAVTD